MRNNIPEREDPVWQDTERYRDRLSKEAPPTIDLRLLGLATDLRVPRMSEVFSELLADARTQDQSPLSKSYHLLRGRVRSPEFGLGLRRIVRQQYEGDLNAKTLAALKNIDRPQSGVSWLVGQCLTRPAALFPIKDGR